MSSLHLFMLVSSISAITEAPIRLDEVRQLFLDDHLIESMTNITRCIHPAEKHPDNPLLWPEQEWEGKVALVYGSVIHDGDQYRMWYLTSPGVSYAESGDGLKWVKPMLDVVEVDGHKSNVVVPRNAGLAHFYELLGVHKDTPEADPSRRYKMGFLSIQRDYRGPREDVFHRGQRRGLGVASSPDGIRWTLVDPWATETICDGPGHWMFDPVRQKYVLYGRTKSVPPEVQRTWSEDPWCQRNCWGRAVTRIESPDFITWDMADPGEGPAVMAPDLHDPLGTEIYSMLVFPYESVYIGLVQVFHNQPDACYLDIQLAVSRDSVHFTRVGDRSPFIPVGPIGSWDRFNNALANNAPILVGDELRFYYSGRTYRHSPYQGPDKGVSGGGIGLATSKRDRFVSLQASFDGGQVVTKPLKLAGRDLHINGKADLGEIVVELLDEQANVVARSVRVRSDSLDTAVRWEQDPTLDLSSTYRLRITLRNALLFSIWYV